MTGTAGAGPGKSASAFSAPGGGWPGPTRSPQPSSSWHDAHRARASGTGPLWQALAAWPGRLPVQRNTPAGPRQTRTNVRLGVTVARGGARGAPADSDEPVSEFVRRWSPGRVPAEAVQGRVGAHASGRQVVADGIVVFFRLTTVL